MLLFSSYYGFSQCGGDDNSITICNKETYNQGLGNPTGVVNLFTLLGGAPVAGGTWTDLNSSGGLNVTTGLLNTWAINQSGIFNYRYTRVGVPGCVDNTGVITLTLGGFPGVDNLNAVACDNTTSVPLFSFLGSNPNPHFNGTWSGVGLPAGSLTGNFFNASLAGEGTYTLTYTVPAIGTCPSENANVTLTVHPLPNAGTSTPLVFCETDDFSTFTNVDLFDQLAGEDAGGTWTENSGTTELSGPGDSFINIQNISLLGPGTYTFTYTVNPSHPICTPATANVAITIEPVVDLNGATLNVDPDICFSQIGTTAIIGTITQGVTPIPNGTYNITYVLTGANTGTQTVPVTFAGGTASFTVNNAFLLSVGTTTVEITSVLDPNTTLDCTRTISNLTSTFIINENPNVSDSQLVIDDICITETAVGNINDSNAPTFELSNGTYALTYSITGPNGTLTGQSSIVTITNGAGSFNISNALTGVAGIYSVTITNVTNTVTNCSTAANITDTFEVFPIPDATTISVSIPNICFGENVIVNVSGATTLPNGSYNIEYDLTGAIVAPNQTATVNFVGGAASFTIPNGLYVIGVSTLTITNLLNTTTTCETTTFTNPSGSFEIHAIPDANDIEISVTDVCLGQGGTVNIFDINPGLAPELTNGSYTITYNLSGANVASNQATSATLTGGSGSFTIPASQLTNIGNTTVSIIIITNVTTGCDAVGVPIITTFDVLPIPIINNVSLTVAQPICQGSGTIATISGASVADGNYELTYDLTGANTLLNQTVSVLFTGGSATFPFTTTQIPNIGSYTLSITNIVDNNTPNACSNPVTGVTTTFVVIENPNITNTTIAATTPICLGSNGTVTLTDLTSSLSNGTYTVTYSLSGSNTASNETTTVTITGGTGSYSIPSALLTNIGTTNVNISLITNQATGCSTIANLNTSFDILLIDANDIEISVIDVCLGQSGTVSIFDTNPGTAPELPNGSYTIIYNLAGANTAANQAITTTLTAGSGTFTIPASQLTNIGNTTVNITTITNVATGCDAVGVPITTTFDVLPIPIINNVSLTVAQPICQGSGTTATISGASIADGNYQLTYDLTGANTLLAQTVSVVFTGGSATFPFTNAQIPNIGSYTLSITNIVDNNTPNACSNPVTGVTTTFVVIENPNITNTTIAAMTPICLGSNGTVTLTDLTNLLANGTYTVTYSLSGANTIVNTTASVTIAGGTGSYTIPSALLTNTGTTNVNISLISNQATGCSTVANLNTSFDILIIDANDIDISVVDVCLGQGNTVNIFDANPGTAPELPNGSYTITYNLSGANTVANQIITTTLTAGSGTFTIPASQLTNIGNTTVNITILTNVATGCDAIGVPLTTTFDVLPIPIINNVPLTVAQPICQGSGTTATISGASIADGNYQLTYDLTGANTLLAQTVSVVFTGGSATFPFTNAQIPNIGSYTLSITNIVDNNTPNACSNPVTGVTTTFVVIENPNITNTTIAATTPICLGSNGTVTLTDLTSSLANGTYTVTYSLSGANTIVNTTASVTIAGGTGSFNIPSALLTNTGTTNVNISLISNQATGCSTVANLNTSFDIQPLPNLAGVNIFVVEPICLGSNATVLFNSPALANGTYDISYNITGANTGSGSASLNVVGGNASFLIGAVQIPNTGLNQVTITSLSNAVTTCSVTVPLITDDFIVNPIPQITSPEITIPNVCLGSNATVTITSTGGLVDGTYNITYSITGVNGPLTQTDSVIITGGVATITIPAAVLTNIGLTSFSISAISNATTTCANTFTNVQVNFIVNPLPNVTPSNVTVADSCIDVDANGTISGATNLPNGNYTFTYDLSGANTATAQNGTTTITAGNGTFTIPATLFTTSGVTTFTITSITNVLTGCTTSGLGISDNFNVIPLPNASNATIAVNNFCLVGGVATVSIANATALADGNYTIIYDLTNANVSSSNSIIVAFTSGSASFVIPSTLLTNAGNTTITIQDLITNTTFCGTSTLAINPITFVISDEAAPTISANGNVFCIQDNPTIANLTANLSPSNTITWYDAATGGTAYAGTEPLINGNTYYASLTIGGGCESSERLEVTVDLTSGCDELFIPDGFSPNNDGLNDEFYIKNIADLYPNFKLEIFNRYGNMVYTGGINTPNFTGKSNQSTFIGKEVLPSGVYFYILYYNDATNKQPVQGRLYLSR